MKFINGKTYLVRRTSKAFGGCIKEMQIENITKKHVKVFDTWQTIKSLNENYTIIEELVTKN